MCKHFISLCLFHICSLSQWSKASHLAKPRVGVEGDKAHETSGCITVTIYHSGLQSQLWGFHEQWYWHGIIGMAWKDAGGRHFLQSGTGYPEYLGAVTHPHGVTMVPDGTRQ